MFCPRIYVVVIFPRRPSWLDWHHSLVDTFLANQANRPSDLFLLCPRTFEIAQTVVCAQADRIAVLVCARFLWGDRREGEDLVGSLKRLLGENQIPVLVLEDPDPNLRRPGFDYPACLYVPHPWGTVGDVPLMAYLLAEASRRNQPT